MNPTAYRQPPNLFRRETGKSLFVQVYRARWLYLALLPSFLLLGIFMLYPALDAVGKSFYYWKISNLINIRPVWVSNYAKLLQEEEFWLSFGNLAIFLAWGFFVTFVILMPVTYLVYKLGTGFFGRWVQRLYVIPMMVPAMVITLYWRFFYEYNFGILNTFLKQVGLAEFIHVWLGEKATALPALLFMGFPWIGGLGFLILLAGFQGIDESLHEAAQIDGANGFQVFRFIDIPMVIPQAKLLIVLGMIAGIQQFGTQMIMTKGGPDGATMVPGLVMYKTAFTNGNLGYGTTMGVALFLIILVVTMFLNKYVQSRE